MGCGGDLIDFYLIPPGRCRHDVSLVVALTLLGIPKRSFSGLPCSPGIRRSLGDRLDLPPFPNDLTPVTGKVIGLRNGLRRPRMPAVGPQAEIARGVDTTTT